MGLCFSGLYVKSQNTLLKGQWQFAEAAMAEYELGGGHEVAKKTAKSVNELTMDFWQSVPVELTISEPLSITQNNDGNILYSGNFGFYYTTVISDEGLGYTLNDSQISGRRVLSVYL